MAISALENCTVMVTTFFFKHIGGLQTHFDTLVRALKERGFQVIGFQLLPKKTPLMRKVALYVREGFNREEALLANKYKQLDEFSDQIWEVISKKKVDLIHCHDVFSVFVLKKIDRPIILTVHGPASREWEMAGFKKEFVINAIRTIESTAYDRANKIISVDTGQKEIIVNDFNVPENKVKVVYNAVDVEEIRFLAETTLHSDLKIEMPFVVVPRRLVPKNGVDVAIRAMRYLCAKSCKLVITGDGPERLKLLDLVKKMGLRERVIFLGEVDHERLFPLLRRSQAVIVPSVPFTGVVEATSLSALEAMTLGKVVIASNLGGLREIINDGVNGFLFEAGNEQFLAELIDRVLNNEELRISIGGRALQAVLQGYSVDSWFGKIMNLYREVLQ
jgi:glycosyltransferase involved in cell wall biosynthesis